MVVCSYATNFCKGNCMIHNDSGKVLSQNISRSNALTAEAKLDNMHQKCFQVGYRTTQAPSQALNINKSASLASIKVGHAFDPRLDDYALVIHGIAQRMPWPCLRLHFCAEFSVETWSTLFLYQHPSLAKGLAAFCSNHAKTVGLLG